MPSLVYKPVGYRDCVSSLPTYLLIECSDSGFQTLEYRTTPGASMHRVELTGSNRSYDDAFNAYFTHLEKARATGSAEIEIGNVPPTERYASMRIATTDEVAQLDEARARALSVDAYVDPRKVRASSSERAKLDADARREALTFMTALHDPLARWFEANEKLVTISKSGGAIAIKDAAGRALGSRADALKLRVAYELGGTFDLEGYVDGDVFVVTDTSRNEGGLDEHIDRARPTVVRRPRRYQTTEERVAILRALLARTTRFVRIESAPAASTPYRYHIERTKLERILALLAPADQEFITHGCSVPI